MSAPLVQQAKRDISSLAVNVSTKQENTKMDIRTVQGNDIKVLSFSIPWLETAGLASISEITSFVCTSKINLLHLKSSLARLIVIVKGLLNLPTCLC